jgi:hypothetical protein
VRERNTGGRKTFKINTLRLTAVNTVGLALMAASIPAIDFAAAAKNW